MNNQKPEPRATGSGEDLDVHSMFFTIQGEGPFSGHRSIFVRLAGCNLRCPGCDTEYTEGRQTWKVRHLVAAVEQLARDHNAQKCLVVITGGEPFRQRIGYLCSKLTEVGHFVQVETNGFFPPDSDVEDLARRNQMVVIVSPKTAKINPVTASIAHSFKYVLDHRSVAEDDGLPIEALAHPVGKGGRVARPPEGKTVYVNPFDDKDEIVNLLNLETAAESCKAHGYILGVQLHKLVGLE